MKKQQHFFYFIIFSSLEIENHKNDGRNDNSVGSQFGR